MEEKIIKILELVQTKDDGTVEFSEESKKLIHEVAEKCRILPIYQQNKEKSKYVQRWNDSKAGIY